MRDFESVVDAVDWDAVAVELDARGVACVPAAIDDDQARDLVNMFDDDNLFRSTINMERLGYGSGEYRYFADPLPELVQGLREVWYSALAPLANSWHEWMGTKVRFPGSLNEMLAQCDDGGQSRPTPLLLRYTTGGYNTFHQDRYGAIAFPLQVMVLLSAPKDDFDGGEFLLLEERHKGKDQRGHSIAPNRGDAVIFPNRWRPDRTRPVSERPIVKHGLSTVHRGNRVALGLIFHNAQ